MTVPFKSLTAAVAALAFAAAAFTITSDAFARGTHVGGSHGRYHLAEQRTGHHHGHHVHLRHRHQRQFFTRFTPCVVWTRHGWTNVCNEAPVVGSAAR